MVDAYQDFANLVQEKLTDSPRWKTTYADYAAALLRNRERIRLAKQTFRSVQPLHRYITIGEAKKLSGSIDFDLRYLGQSVGQIRGAEGTSPKLTVNEKTAQNSARFGWTLGEIDGADWRTSPDAAQFRAFYRELLHRTDTFPRQQEHMVESALFSELEKKIGNTKQLKFIQPISYEGVRLHMKTALKASGASSGICEVSESGSGGDIDIFCRRKTGNHSRLTVIEVKDENIAKETFHLAVKQAIAYAVFIRELARSESGQKWMELWGLGNCSQTWQQGFTIDAVAAMPKGTTADFSFTGHTLELGQDRIELHYLAFLGVDKPRDEQDVQFETSL